MVKVIKYGKKRRIVCPDCGSLLEFEAEDVKSGQSGMNEYYNYIECPNCNAGIKVPYAASKGGN